MGQGVAIKNFQSPFYCHHYSDGDRIFSVTTKMGLSYFLESSKNMLNAPFFFYN
jgi:hypothetical protein